MSILETATVFVGVPALIYAVIAGLVYLSSGRPGRRYRPGRPFEFTPVWFVARPEADVESGRAAIEATGAAEPADGEPAGASVKGGASGSW